MPTLTRACRRMRVHSPAHSLIFRLMGLVMEFDVLNGLLGFYSSLTTHTAVLSYCTISPLMPQYTRTACLLEHLRSARCIESFMAESWGQEA